MKQLSFLLLLLSFSSTLFAQRSESLIKEAVHLMDDGLFAASKEKLEQAKRMDPKNLTVDYEMAYWHFLQEQYGPAIQILTKIVNKKEATSQYIQMLGICYSVKGENEKAIKVFDKAIKKYPSKGVLYMERSVMEFKEKRYTKAVSFLEKGVQVEPSFPSNYYRLGQVFLGTDNEVWGMIYGELFMNLERSSGRTSQMSSWIYDTYKSEINFSEDTVTVSFTKNTSLQITSTNVEMADLLARLLNFSLAVDYEELLQSNTYHKVDSISLASLHTIRTGFIQDYYEKELDKKHKNILFAYQKEMLDLGILEAYNYWLLQEGDKEAFAEWKSNNEELWTRFIEWFSQNPLKIDATNYFLRPTQLGN